MPISNHSNTIKSRYRAASKRGIISLLTLALFAMCITPVPAWVCGSTKNGKPRLVFTSRQGMSVNPTYYLPCGKCLGCQTDKRNRWIARMTLEHACHDYIGTFITLTYADAPTRLVKADVQKFLKRFRNIPRDYGFKLPNFKYFFCGEYGSKFGRPHYHGLLFGLDPFISSLGTDIVTWKDNFPIYSSSVLSSVWDKGFITVDKITEANIRYVSKYILKSHQKKGDEFTLKSIGLGSDFFFDFPDSKHRSKVQSGRFYTDYSLGLLHMIGKNGNPYNLPIPYKAFDRYLEKVDPNLLDVLKFYRKEFVANRQTTAQDFRNRLEWLQVMNAEKPNERVLDNET